MTLERRCRMLARAYPDRARAEEVLTTLLDSNEGRRSPRVADAADVLWHGVAARFGSTAPGTRLGWFGDVLSVAVVLAVLVQSATAVAIGVNSFRHPPASWVWPDIARGVWYLGPADAVTGVLAAAVAAAACTAICLGRVVLARVLVLAAAAGGAATFLAERSLGQRWTYRSDQARLLVLGGVAVVLAVLGTSAVARAARVVPRWWWPVAAGASLSVAYYVVRYHPNEFRYGRSGVAVTAYVAVAMVLAAVAVPVALRSPATPAGAVLLAAPAEVIFAADRIVARVPTYLYVAGAAWTLVALVAAVARRAREVS